MYTNTTPYFICHTTAYFLRKAKWQGQAPKLRVSRRFNADSYSTGGLQPYLLFENEKIVWYKSGIGD